MPPKRSNPEAKLYHRAVLTPCLAALISAVMVYWYELQTYQGMDIDRAEAAAAAMALIVYFAIHTMYTGLFVTLMRWKHEEKMAEIGSTKGQAESVKAAWSEVNQNGYQEGRYYNFGAAVFEPSRLQAMCRAVSNAGKLTERTIRRVTDPLDRSKKCTRNDYIKLRDQFVKHHLAYRDSRGAVVMRESGLLVARAIGESPTGGLKIVRQRDSRLSKQAQARPRTFSAVGEGLGYVRERVG